MKKLFYWLVGCLMLASCTGVTTGTNSVGGVESSVTYQTAAICPQSNPDVSVTVTGIRGVNNSNNVYITGVFVESGVGNIAYIYTGPLNGGGTCESFVYPGALNTSFYGPDNGDSGYPRAVGSYNTESNATGTYGLLFIESAESSQWITLIPSSLESEAVSNTIAHSVMGNLVVGNYMVGNSLGRAFIYDINTGTYNRLHYPGAISMTAYGIWYNGGESYTIAGGYTLANESQETAYLVDWNDTTHVASNWTSYVYMNMAPSSGIATHFEGLTTDGSNGYNVAAGGYFIAQNTESGAFVNIPRNSDGSFGISTWVAISYPGADLTTANSVYENNVLGVYSLSGSSLKYPYIATIPWY